MLRRVKQSKTTFCGIYNLSTGFMHLERRAFMLNKFKTVKDSRYFSSSFKHQLNQKPKLESIGKGVRTGLLYNPARSFSSKDISSYGANRNCRKSFGKKRSTQFKGHGERKISTMEAANFTDSIINIKNCIDTFEYANAASRDHSVGSYPSLISNIIEKIKESCPDLEGKQVAILCNPGDSETTLVKNKFLTTKDSRILGTSLFLTMEKHNCTAKLIYCAEESKGESCAFTTLDSPSASQPDEEVISMISKMTKNDNSPTIILNACFLNFEKMESLVKNLIDQAEENSVVYVPVASDPACGAKTLKDGHIWC